MEIRRAEERDIRDINALLRQVLAVHHEGRPDLFRANSKKYDDEQLLAMLKDETRPIFVAAEEDRVVGYAFCMFIETKNDNVLCDHKTLYIDDLCVDEKRRGKHIGQTLYHHVLSFAEKSGCHNVTLNVWECNPGARKFYEKMGLRPYKTCMETVLR